MRTTQIPAATIILTLMFALNVNASAQTNSVGSGNNENRNTLASKCSKDDAVSCERLGLLWASGEGGPKDKAKSRTLFEKACKLNRASACAYLGRIYYKGDGVNKDPEKKFLYWRKACELGNEKSCDHVYVWIRDKKAPQNINKLLRYYENKCSADNSKACSNLAYMLSYSGYQETDGWFKSRERVNDLFIKSCELNNSTGCYNAGKFYGVSSCVFSREFSQKSLDKILGSLKYNKKACSLGLGKSCDVVANILKCGGGTYGTTKKNYVKIVHEEEKKYRQLACKNGFGKCGKQKHIATRAENSEECNNGSAEGCARLAYQWLKGQGGEKDPPKARNLFSKACQQSGHIGCLNYGKMWLKGDGGPKNPGRAREIFESTCFGDGSTDGRACNALAPLFLDGIGGSPDLSKAKLCYEKSCYMYAANCKKAADMYLSDRFGKIDHQKAKELYQTACRKGDKESCKEGFVKIGNHAWEIDPPKPTRSYGFTYQEAQRHCSSLSLGGLTWRLPTIEEANNEAYNKRRKSMNPKLRGPGNKDDWYWTTLTTQYIHYRFVDPTWGKGFNYRKVDSGGQRGSYGNNVDLAHVRCVAEID